MSKWNEGDGLYCRRAYISSLLGDLVHPPKVQGIVHIGLDGLTLLVNEGLILAPLEQPRVLDAVLGPAGCVGNGTNLEGGLGREQLEGALEASCDARQDDPSLSLEALSTTIDHRNDGVRIDFAILACLHQTDQHRVHVATSLDRIETADDDVELSVEVVVLVFDTAIVTGS